MRPRSGRDKIRESILRPTWRFLKVSPLPQHLLGYLVEDVGVGPGVPSLVCDFGRFNIGWISPRVGIRNRGLRFGLVGLEHPRCIDSRPLEVPPVVVHHPLDGLALVLAYLDDKVLVHDCGRVKPRSQTMPSSESLLQVTRASAPANLKLMMEFWWPPLRVSSATFTTVSTDGSSSSWASMIPTDGSSLWMKMSVTTGRVASRLTSKNCCSPVAVMSSI